MLPVGVPLPGAVAETVAVNVTLWPQTAVVDDEVRAVEVAAGETVWLRVAEVLAAKTVLPL
jgi:hypothetical protein